MTENNYHAEILRPFGPRIAKTKVPMCMVHALNKECDRIIEDQERRKEFDVSNELVGHVSEELFCDLNLPDLQDFQKYLKDLSIGLTDEFTREQKNKPMPDKKFIMDNSWFVRSFKGEYNPAHIHNGGNLVCVLYLKVPESVSQKNTKNVNKLTTEGYIDFFYGASLTLTQGNFTCMPEVGDLYVFPSYLMHTVYPFYGEGERRSFSANYHVGI